MRRPRIHVIGDSHSLSFVGIGNCLVHHVGPKTMFSLRKNNWNLPTGEGHLDVRIFGVRRRDYVVYVFGEIDVRVHIERISIRNQKTISKVIDDLIYHYINRVVINAEISSSIPIISSILPPSHLQDNPEFPFYGSLQTRVLIQRELNTKLELACRDRSILYLNYASRYQTFDGTLDHRFSDGHVHIKPEYNDMIEEELHHLLCRNRRCYHRHLLASVLSKPRMEEQGDKGREK